MAVTLARSGGGQLLAGHGEHAGRGLGQDHAAHIGRQREAQQASARPDIDGSHASRQRDVLPDDGRGFTGALLSLRRVPFPGLLVEPAHRPMMTACRAGC